MAYSDLVAALEALPGKGQKKVCPSHEDRLPSLTWKLGDDGRLLIHCHAGCRIEEIVAAMGATMSDLYAEHRNGHSGARVRHAAPSGRRQASRGERAFDAYYVDGTKAGVHRRADDGQGGKRIWWDPKGIDISRLALFCSWELGDADPVVIVEGERATLAVTDAGIAAVGTYGANAMPSREALLPLAGRHVVLWPDHDDAGRQHMTAIELALVGVAASVLVVRPPDGTPKGWDAADADVDTIRQLVTDASPTGPRIVRLSQVESIPIEWLWPGWMPLGTVTLFDGNPGEAKSTCVMDLVARITTGRAWPDGTPGGEPGDVLIITREDDPSRVLRPRLEVAGADLDRVHFLVEEFVMPKDTAKLARAIASMPRLRLVFIDPLFSHIEGTVRTISDNDVRTAVMSPLANIAAEYDIAVLAMRHFSKDTSRPALLRGSGSLGGLAGAARSVWTATVDPDDETGASKLLGVTKSNYAQKPDTLRYRVISATPPGRIWIGRTVSAVEWLGSSAMSVDDVMSEEDHETSRTATEILVTFLETRGGEAPAQECQAHMRSKGYARAAWTSAKRRSGVTSVKSDFDAGWVWRMPPSAEDAWSPINQSSSTSSASSTSSGGSGRGHEDVEDVEGVEGAGSVTRASTFAAGDGDWLRPCRSYDDHRTRHRRVAGGWVCDACDEEEALP